MVVRPVKCGPETCGTELQQLKKFDFLEINCQMFRCEITKVGIVRRKEMKDRVHVKESMNNKGDKMT